MAPGEELLLNVIDDGSSDPQIRYGLNGVMDLSVLWVEETKSDGRWRNG